MFLSANCVSSQGVSLCDRVLVGPVKETSSFVELFDLFVARHVGDAACSGLVERCSFYNLQKGASTSQVVQSPLDTPVEVMQAFDCNAVKFVLATNAQNREADRRPSVFDRMMDGSRSRFAKTHLLEKFSRPAGQTLPADERLFNDLVDLLDKQNVRWSAASVDSARQFVSVLSRALYYIDGHRERFRERHISLPVALQSFTGYNNPAATKHKLASLSVEKLSMHVDRVSGVLLLPFLNGADYKVVKGWASGCCDAMKHITTYLSGHAARQRSTASAAEPARTPGDDSSCTIIPCAAALPVPYKDVEKVLDLRSHYEIVELMEFAPADRYERRHWVDSICSKSTLALFKFHSGGSHQAVICVWKLPQLVEERDESRHAHCIAEVMSKAKLFHSRAMRRDFLHRWQIAFQGKAANAALKAIYAELTGDSSALITAQEKETREKLLEWILDSDESNFLVDYHSGSGQLKDGDFQPFWDEVNKYMNEQELAVHERRHGETMFLPLAVSMTSLHRSICDRLEAGPHKGCKKPSAELLRLQFQPSSPYINSAAKYTGRFNIRYAVQQRQIHGNNVDSHYANAQFKYLKEYAIAHASDVAFFCLDDKAGIPVGEPSTALSTGVRGHNRSLVASGQSLAASDHDWHVAGITPSVSLRVDVPESLAESFFSGQVSVTCKERVFQPSSPFRHSRELADLFRTASDPDKKVLLLYTDGGPNHRVTFGSVQLALVCLFMELDLDQLIAVRTCASQSWINPAERCMSLLNLALQHVSLSRAAMDEDKEKLAKSCTTMADLRSAASKHEGFKEAYIDSMAGVINAISARFEQLELKGVPVSVQEPASDESISRLFEHAKSLDSSLKMLALQKADIAKASKYCSFRDRHTRATHYTFQIRKCVEDPCDWCKDHPPSSHTERKWLPCPEPGDDKSYKAFASVLDGREPDERHRPSLAASLGHPSDARHGDIMNSNKVRTTIQCNVCDKPRCVYAKLKLTKPQQEAIAYLVASHEYTCGAPLFADGHEFAEIAVVRRGINCGNPIEVPYYNAKVAVPCCFFCGKTSGLLLDSDPYMLGMRRKYSVVSELLRCGNLYPCGVS